ncbi:MAG: hypothetical protein IJ760_00575 [Bacteroidales bacterium]|nr:hypothetical protein [Bacteroidales bacterium]
MKRMTIVLLLMAAGVAVAQDRSLMAAHQQRLAELFERTASAPTDNERYLASEEAVQELAAALDEEQSERWQWKLPNSVSVLTSPDKKLRVFTWAVVSDEGEFECFGAVQFYNDRSEQYEYRLLNDKSDEVIGREESVLRPDCWLGAIYQDLLQTTASDRTYYTLLGWNGVDNITDMRVIEPVTLRGGTPQFGAAVFRRERNLRRVVLEYRGDAAVGMGYDEQTVSVTTRERVKKNGRYVTVEKTKEHKERMIIFDEVEPQMEGMKGLFQYYVPSGAELAYVWVDGKWELRHGAQGRLADKKLNKSFAPLPKSSPSYEYKQN